MRSSARYAGLALASGVVSLVAMGLPCSPASYELVPLAGSWHPLVSGPWLLAALLSGSLLRARLVCNSRVSPWLAGAAHALVSAVFFTFLFNALERWIQGGGSFGAATQEGLLYIPYGLMVVLLSAHIALPVGMLFVRCARAAANRP